MENEEKENLFYKYRSINALLHNFKELEEEYIYFAPAKDLNDPLEGYMDIDFKGDKIIWRNFLKNYIFSLFIFRNIVILTKNDKELSSEDIHVAFNSRLKEEQYTEGKSYKISCDEILKNKYVIFLIEYLSERETSISKTELYFYLLSLHFYILDIFNKIEIEKGGEIENKALLYKRLDSYEEEQNDLINLLDSIKKIGVNGVKLLYILFQYTNKNIESVLYAKILTSSNSSFIDKNYNLLISFPKIYINKLDEIMYPRPYVTCFTKDFKDLSLWGYYSDSSKGACLIFKAIKKDNNYYLPIKKIKNYSTDETIPVETNDFVNAEIKPVEYTKQKPAIPFFRSLGRLTLTILQKHWYSEDGIISETVKDIFNKEGKNNWRKEYWEYITKNTNTKQENWKHEKEYRISLISTFDDEYDTVEKRKLKYKFDNLEGIIFGINTKESDKIKVIKVLYDKCKKYNRKDFKVYQAIYDNQKGEISTIPINILKYIENV